MRNSAARAPHAAHSALRKGARRGTTPTHLPPPPPAPPPPFHPPCSQEFFHSKGWENKPIRCEACRKLKKQQQEQRDGGRGGYQQGGFGGQGAFGGGAFGSRQGAGGQGGRSCYNCGKVRGCGTSLS